MQESQASGPLKEKEGTQQNMQLPREVIQQLRDVVFGFDTFYVTSVENYQANGVLFKGNLRGRSAAESYTRTAARLKVFSATADTCYAIAVIIMHHVTLPHVFCYVVRPLVCHA